MLVKEATFCDDITAAFSTLSSSSAATHPLHRVGWSPYDNRNYISSVTFTLSITLPSVSQAFRSNVHGALCTACAVCFEFTSAYENDASVQPGNKIPRAGIYPRNL